MNGSLFFLNLLNAPSAVLPTWCFDGFDTAWDFSTGWHEKSTFLQYRCTNNLSTLAFCFSYGEQTQKNWKQAEIIGSENWVEI